MLLTSDWKVCSMSMNIMGAQRLATKGMRGLFRSLSGRLVCPAPQGPRLQCGGAAVY